MAVVIPSTGWLQQRFTTRQLFGLSTVSFTIGAVIAFLSPGFAVLVVGRVVQAFGTAIAMPLLMSTVMEVVPAHRRGRMMGLVSMVISVAPALGPVVSGLVLETMSWRALFGIMIPIGLAVVLVGAKWIPNVNELGERPRLDILSLPLAAVGFGGTVYGLSSIGNSDLPSWVLPAALVAGGIGLIVFVIRQLRLARTGEPLLDVRVFRNGRFTVPVVLMMLAMMGMFGVLIMLPLLLQRSFGMAPLEVGLLMLPGSLLTGLLGPVVGNAYDRIGPRPLVIPGTAVAAAAFGLLFFVTAETPTWYFLMFHILLSIGLALTFSPTFTSALGSLPHHQYGHGSASLSTAQQVAGAAGNSGFVSIMSIGIASATAAGMSDGAAMLAGAHTAFLFAAIVQVIVFGLAWFVRRPVD
jgi:DHA2 family lincomycin resistance protein-like MFS transporter